MACAIAECIHSRLSGLEDYVESEVLLNVDEDTITLGVGEHSNKFTFMAALGDLIGLEAYNRNPGKYNKPEDSLIGYKTSALKQMHSFTQK